MAEVFSPAPPFRADIRWSESRAVEAGDMVPTSAMEDRPSVMSWPHERGALYTVMILDAGISRILPE